jgi:hypothetical protein
MGRATVQSVLLFLEALLVTVDNDCFAYQEFISINILSVPLYENYHIADKQSSSPPAEFSILSVGKCYCYLTAYNGLALSGCPTHLFAPVLTCCQPDSSKQNRLSRCIINSMVGSASSSNALHMDHININFGL